MNVVVDDAATSTDFFGDYVETTLDPEWSLIIGSLVACILLHATLPCMSSLGSRYERRNKSNGQKQHLKGSMDEDDTSEDQGTSAEQLNEDTMQNDDLSIQKSSQPSILLEKLQLGTDVTFDVARTTGETVLIPLGHSRKNNKASSFKKAFDNANNHDRLTGMTPIAEESELDGGGRANQAIGNTVLAVYKENRRTQVGVEDGMIQWFCGVTETWDRVQSHVSRPRSIHSRHSTKSRKKNAADGTDSIDIKNEELSVLSRASSKAAHTVLSRLHHDDVSFTEAIDNYQGPALSYPRKDESDSDSGDVDILCGERAWWKPKMLRSAVRKLVKVSDVDDEMKSLLHMALPLSAYGFITGSFNLLDVSLIGYLAGTEDAAVFVIVSLLTWLPTTLTYGIFEALAKLIPDAANQDDGRLAGTYISTALVLFSVAMVPIGLFWSLLTRSTFLRFGFDDSTALLAQHFAYVQISHEWVSGIGYGVNLFLDVIGHDRFSSSSGLVFGCGQTAAILLQTILGKKSLVNIGICRSLFASLHVVATIFLAAWKGWLDGCNRGNATVSFTTASARLSVTAFPLGLVYFLTYGQWEILTLFAGALGPAEMVAWAIMGYLWSILKYGSDGIADAAESQSALHLLLNEPDLAKISAGKSHFLGLFISSLITSILFLIGMELTKGMSPDPTIQRLMIEIFPLVGIGNIVQTTVSISSSLLGAQERFGIVVVVQVLGNWCLAIVLGTVFTFGFQIDLQGVASAIVLGLGLSSSGVTYLLLRSDWDLVADKFSRRFIREQAMGEETP
ncbi:MATE efflux family protein [Nitzschia inconspicua]|uniref:MATE efflux family protein n=1 Tax=Nitzschia inconspicua TaxID=303405 RepID=A0A9K3KFY1_9STRA|nr:MATE efflux family protein [Nitzschia inconspicua]